MKKILLILFAAIFAFNGAAFAATNAKELNRMGIFISNFTEVGMFDFDLEKDGDDAAIHLGDPENFGELIYFGIIHNYINNPKTTIKKCRDKDCPYGDLTVSGKSVAASVKRYFDLDIKPRSDLNRSPALYYDKNGLYHFAAPKNQGTDDAPIYYADVKNVKRSPNGKIIIMTGDIYNLNNKKDRPATFTATAKPYKWNGKNTWAVLSLTTDWR